MSDAVTVAGVGATERVVTSRSLDARRTLRRLFVAADTLAAVLAAGISAPVAGLGALRLSAWVMLVALVWVSAAYLAGLYAADDPPSWPAGVAECRRILILALAVSWPLAGLGAALGAPAGAGLLAAGAILALTVAARGGVRVVAQRAHPMRQRTLIIGSGVVAHHLADRLLRSPELGLQLVGVVDDDPHEAGPADLPHLGRRDDLGEILDAHAVDRVIVAFSRATHEELLEAIRTCWDSHVAIDVIPRLFELLDGARRVDRVGGLPVMAIDAPSLTGGARGLKRALDIVVSAGLLIILAPVLLALALAIKLDSRGAVLFRQTRAGRDGRVFSLVKFRSMRSDAEARKPELSGANEAPDPKMFKIRRDPRITRVGGWLRRTSLDELPQLLNVLRGEMSLVGPRPLILSESDAITGWQARRLALRPGMTGPWQVYGRSELPFDDMLRYDYQYVAGWSLARDLEILLATIPAILSGRGAY